MSEVEAPVHYGSAEAFAWQAGYEAARAAAWDEGYTRGFYDREKLSGDSRDASEGATENPYYSLYYIGPLGGSDV